MSAATVATALLAVMATVALLNLVAAPRLHRWRPRRRGPRVSVLIPARDEADNLRRTLPALLRSDYAPLELIVLDDTSTDGTAEAAAAATGGDPRVRIIPGAEPPPGWTGKNWACHQLARRATGELLLFCDADVTAGPDAVGRTVEALSAGECDVVTALPRQRYPDTAPRAIVPLVAQVPLAALLPLFLVHRTRAASVSAGNGQWMAWRRDAYERVGGHGAVRGDVLEDVRLARHAKRLGLRLLVAAAPHDLEVTMYADAAGVRAGFAKNLYPLMGATTAGLMATLGVFLLTMLLPFPLAASALRGGGPALLCPLALLLVVRGATAALFRDGARGVLLHPLGALVVPLLALESAALHRRGAVSWKRRIVAPEAP